MTRHSRSPALGLLLSLSLLAGALGQNPRAQQQPPPAADDEVVRITTSLVQLDAVVVDKDGRQVTDLRAEDFEVFEDDKPQRVTNFAYVSTAAAATPREGAPPAAAPPPSPAGVAAPPAPVQVRQGAARRTLVLFLDDVCLNFESLVRTRDALRKFVAEQVRPGDLVAVLRSSKTTGVLQQLTSDPRQIQESIARIRFSSGVAHCRDPYDPTHSQQLPATTLSGGTAIKEQRAATHDSVFDEFNTQIGLTTTLASLSLALRGLQKLPGRKSLILFTNGFSPWPNWTEMDSSSGGRYATHGVKSLELIEQLIDSANRASVVIYAVDPRGLEAPLAINHNFSGASPEAVMGALQRPGVAVFRGQMDVRRLAEYTGGFLVRNTNDIGGGLRRVAAELEGYYLIGYRPDDSTFDPKTGRRVFRTLKVRVRRPGLTVRTRVGFLAVPGAGGRPSRTPAGDPLAEALISPFAGAGLRLRLTSLFSDDPRAGSVMRSLIHVDARDLTFTEEPDGRRKAVFDVAGATFGAAGQVVEKIDQTSYTMRVSERVYRRLLQTGFVYTIDFPVKRSGAFQLRFSVRDQATQRVGSTGHSVVVPDLGDGRLALSGLILRGREQAAATQPAGEQDAEPDVQASAAVRRFRPGATLDYAYLVYNATTIKHSPRPQLTEQVRLFRDGKLIYTGPETPLGVEGQADLKRIGVSGELQLGPTAAPGEYTIQIVVKDALAPEKRHLVTQWIDFEIVN
jgi:VWFA-related protein